MTTNFALLYFNGYSYRYLKPRTFIHFNIKNVNLENLQILLQIKTINT